MTPRGANGRGQGARLTTKIHHPGIRPVGYAVATHGDGRRVLQALAARFSVRRERQPDGRVVYLDTFDWRLHERGLELSLERRNGTSILSLQSGDQALHERVPQASAPGFADDVPAGPMHDAVATVIDVRRLLPLARVTTRSQALRILDDQEKTVARIQLVSATAADPEDDGSEKALGTRLRVLPVRGYPAALRRVTHYLEQELRLAPGPTDDFDEVMHLVGRRPGDYSSKLDLRLVADMSADEAVMAIGRRLRDALVANEDGVRRDLDPEFLHDFRVACRRTRSLLTQVDAVFTAAVRNHFRREFKWLGRMTGPVRDMDVHLQQMHVYENELDQSAHADLEPLGEYLRRHRAIERQRLTGALRSKRYRKLIADWSEHLDVPPDDRTISEIGQRPIMDVASERIWRTYKKLITRARAITPETPGEALHRLRIDCKKLRYLLEFFSSLYDEEEIRPLVKSLKQLQDNLGDFNDLEVQQYALRRMAADMNEEGLASIACVLTMGRLVEHCHRRQQEERRRFARCFAQFDKEKNRHRFRHLFRPGDAI